MRSSRLLFVFVDALGPTQLATIGDRLGALPHTRALDGIVGYSSGALPTILTGTSPRVHGRMCLFSRANDADDAILSPLRWLGLLPRVVHERGPVRRAVAKIFARAKDLRGYVALHKVPPASFAWLGLPERDDLFTAPAIGGAATFLDDARRAGLGVYASPWQLAEDERWRAIDEALTATPPDLAFLYATSLDGALHAHGNDARATRDFGDLMGDRIARAQRRMRAGGRDVTTIVVGDHGMGDVHAVTDPRATVARIETRAPALKLFVDSTMLRMWGPSTALATARAELERAAWKGHFLDAHALATRDVPTAGAPYGDAIFLLDEGGIFAPSHVGGRARGMHGYDLGSPSSRAAIASGAPLPASLRSLVDVASWVRDRLDLRVDLARCAS